MPTFKRIIENKSTEQFSGLPYIYSLLNCLICSWYGLPWVTQGTILVATVNSFGALFHSAYIILFIINSERRKRVSMSALTVGVLCAFALIVCASLELLEGRARRNFVGYLSATSLVSMFASPLFIISLVIRTKSVEFMPFHLSLATYFMSIAFFAYGVLLNDFFIYVSN
ncbi:Bidirectional sugar transporter SWEET2a [Platanthera zijinensis]|uniref:Bidirectional sugar transporter SWEET2a n=1 Tax=Platanthera zijinensis TaxID=2320716 RepID=A0AAP0FVC2_9ASPA